MKKLGKRPMGIRIAFRLTFLSMLIWSLYFGEAEPGDDHIPENTCIRMEPTYGHRFNHTTFAMRTVTSIADCLAECKYEKCCRSVNYRKATGIDRKENCLLFLHMVSEDSKHLVEDANFDYILLPKPFKEFDPACPHPCLPGFSGQRCEEEVPISCKDLLQKDSTVKDGVYTIKTNTKTNHSKVYCRMTSLPGCSGGGWTLVMKIDGDKETFKYSSSYWQNKKPYNPTGGWSGLDNKETKLPTYWSTPFHQVCVGMKVGNDLKFISIKYTASSLYSLIADGQYRSTNIGRQKWKSLISGSSLQYKCNREGFNLFSTTSRAEKARFGLIANEYENCNSPDSYIGFGGIATSLRKNSCEKLITYTNTCGNVARCNPDNGLKNISAIGYIFIR